MLYYSNAKINLGLNIVEKREDGFHNIETVFYPIAVKDALEFIPAKKMELTSSGIEIDCRTEDNLIVKAYRLLQKDFDLPILKFHIHKNIPFGAGLGGGSANAAATLLELNKFYKLNISEEKMLLYAQKLGSDCAFFIKNKTVYAEQKGDIFSDLSLDLSSYYILLVYPQFGVSTQEAYANITPQKPKENLKDVLKQDIELWKDNLFNAFETNILKKHPLLGEIKERLYSNGAVYASMSGSGSCIFGIFKEEPKSNYFDNFWTWKGQL